MLPELGQFALVLAAVLALVQSTLPLIGAQTGNEGLMRMARGTAAGQFVFLVGALAILTHAFVVQDFSVAYVAHNSNLALPWYYRISAVWGAHEGSLLLWVVILSLWTVLVAIFSQQLPLPFVARVLAVMGMISLGFLAFTLFTSNPFLRMLPAALDGNDLNPLLQDPGLIIHPPMLYMGYVGFAVAFAFAVAALIEGRVDAQWVRWSRPWTNIAWGFLTLGIALGSWWAYYELGWGGWWFWDPVENASFMPWLAGVALIHSQAVSEKRGAFQGWTLLLALTAFSLSLLGTFLVRSGVLTSVHAFATDPERGLFILIFLAIVIGGSLTLYAIRAPGLPRGAPFAAQSRETMLLLNNLLFAVACAMVLIGTLSPLLVEVLGLGKISVGPPYFGFLFTLLMAPVVALMPFGPLTRWGSDRFTAVFARLRWMLVLAIILGGLALAVMQQIELKAAAGLFLAAWLALGTLLFVIGRLRQSGRLTAEMTGMSLAHMGVAVFVVGVMMVETTSVERDLALSPGDSVEVAGYSFRFEGAAHHEGPNFTSERGTIVVSREGQEVTRMHPQKRRYLRGQVMTEADLHPGFTRDLYVALGEPIDDRGGWAVRIYHKPFIRWIWLGALMMMAGGFVTALDRRFRKPVPAADSVPVPTSPATSGAVA